VFFRLVDNDGQRASDWVRLNDDAPITVTGSLGTYVGTSDKMLAIRWTDKKYLPEAYGKYQPYPFNPKFKPYAKEDGGLHIIVSEKKNADGTVSVKTKPLKWVDVAQYFYDRWETTRD